MGYTLLWIENLAVSLLFVATLVACIGRLKPSRRWLRSLLSILVGLVPLLLYGGATALVGAAYYCYNLAGWQFRALLLLTLAYVAGASWLLVRGLRHQKQQAVALAEGWPRGRLALALLGVAALHLMTFWNMDVAARQQASALRAEAGALALSVAPARVPDRDNAAVIYRQAFAAMGEREFTGSSSGEREEPLLEAYEKTLAQWEQSGQFDLDPHDPDLRRLLERAAPALTLLRRAAAKPACFFDRDYARPGPGMLVPEPRPMRQGSRLLALDAICRAADSDYRGAIEDINAMYGTAEHLGSDPILICTMSAVSCDRLAIRAIQLVLASGQVPAEDLAELKIADTLSYRTLYERALRMEEAALLAILDQVAEAQGNIELGISLPIMSNTPPIIASCFAVVYRVFLLSDDSVAVKHLAARLDATAMRPYAQAREILQGIYRDLRARPGGIICGVCFPALTPALRFVAQGDAFHNLARLGVATYCYRDKNGRFPEKLDELVPDFIPLVPFDPFDGQPMRVKRTDRGVVIYSVGPDLVDDGGASYVQEKQTGDVTFGLFDEKP